MKNNPSDCSRDSFILINREQFVKIFMSLNVAVNIPFHHPNNRISGHKTLQMVERYSHRDRQMNSIKKRLNMSFKNSGRYSIPSNEDFEPDSNNEVLKNYLRIKSKEIIEGIEQLELEIAEKKLWQIYDENHQFSAEDIRDIHELWLADIYPSAGKYRTVTLGKNEFFFAAPLQIEKLMIELEQKYLAKYTPCHFPDANDLAYALGIVHVELILIHPFREGNGRTARLLADLMAIQAKHPPLNYSSIDQTLNQQGFEQYILAIHAGHQGDYKPIKKIFITLLEQSI